MSCIPPMGGFQAASQAHSTPRQNTQALPTETLAILKDMGVHTLRNMRLQTGLAFSPALKDLAQVPLTADQKNTLSALGLQGVLVALFAEEAPNYKERLKNLHEHILGEETIHMLQDAFGTSATPILIEDDNHNAVMLLQASIKTLEQEQA